jgi:hypothetical protein
VFRVVETRPGWVPSIRRGRGVHTTGPRSPIVPRRFPTTSPLRRTRNPSPTVYVTTHTKIHSRLPVRSFPARNSRMDRESLGISVGFTPPSYPDRMPRREERLDTRPVTASTPPILHSLQPLAPRDITSHSCPLPDVSSTPFPTRSPRQSSANAAVGGLKPPPAGRLRRANLHLPRSTASRSSTYIGLPSPFVTHENRTFWPARTHIAVPMG